MKDGFVYGFLFAIIVVSIVLGSQYGDNFNYLKTGGIHILPSFGEAINWKTAIALCLTFALFYKNVKATAFWRILLSFLLVAVCWASLDLLWILKAQSMGNFLFGSSTLTAFSQKDLLVGVIRNIAMLAVSIPLTFRLFKLSWLSIVTILLVFCYWFYLLQPVIFGYPKDVSPRVSLATILFYQPICYFINFLPFIVSFKERCGVSWRKLLLA